jgi:hypothetical protein
MDIRSNIEPGQLRKLINVGEVGNWGSRRDAPMKESWK